VSGTATPLRHESAAVSTAGQRQSARQQQLVGILDIGSNSVRLVVYLGRGRMPLTLFNEKVMCGLGRGVGQRGALEEQAMEQAHKALIRFSALCKDMGVSDVRSVATAAVRDASNGPSFIRDAMKRTGLDIDIIAGDEEARLSALGVLSSIPEADGIVADLGGGSLELVRVSGGKVGTRISLPIGPLNLLAKESSVDGQEAMIRKALAKVEWLKEAHGKPIYMVGGAWRALSHLHMHVTNHPLRVIHEYAMPTESLDDVLRVLKTLDKKTIKAIPNMTSSRLPALPLAGILLKLLAESVKSKMLVASSFGLREGILYERLSAEARTEDPLIAGCRIEAAHEGRFPEHGDMLMRWMDPVFSPGESAEFRRLRLATCLLADVAWRGHPDFRADRALDMSLFGNFVGIDARGRAMIGMALFEAYAGEDDTRISTIADKLLNPYEQDVAEAWGLALRLGQRLTGGASAGLEGALLKLTETKLTMQVSRAHADLIGELVEKRLKALAEHFDLVPGIEVRG
jgi:exopolyphosphatase / guanosine-5'-triphosphate,3'-diphosphate pyrophosphatase